MGRRECSVQAGRVRSAKRATARHNGSGGEGGRDGPYFYDRAYTSALIVSVGDFRRFLRRWFKCIDALSLE